MKLSKDHKRKIAASLSKDSASLVAQIRLLRDDYSLREIAKKLDISYSTLSRIIKKHNIKLSGNGVDRARAASREGSIGKIPWNKGEHLTPETCRKIGDALRGRPGHAMTDEQKEKWRESYANGGADKMREWLKSPAGKAARRKIDAKWPETRSKLSKIMVDKIACGEYNPNCNSKQGWHQSPKAGRIYYRSSYELRYYGVLDSDDNVITYETEALRIQYEYGGVKKHYVPDVLVYRINGTITIEEIKPEKLLEIGTNPAKFAAAQRYCDKHGLVFKVITENEISMGCLKDKT